MLSQNQTFIRLFIILFLFVAKSAEAQFYDDSLATDRHLRKISSTAFMNLVLKTTGSEKTDPLDMLHQLGLYIDSECDEICETYLKEKKGKDKMLLPSDFDQGVMGMLFSPSNSYFVIYSSYDGPDYASYYHYRAEIIVYPILAGNGLEAIGEPREYHLYDWSIEELFWADENRLALRAYRGTRTTSSLDGGYSYLQLPLK